MIRFGQLAAGELAVSIEDVESELDSPLGFAAVLLPGTCAEQSEPTDFDGAIDVLTFDEGETPEFQLSPDQVQDLLASPHAVLITNGPGDLNLACADIAI